MIKNSTQTQPRGKDSQGRVGEICPERLRPPWSCCSLPAAHQILSFKSFYGAQSPVPSHLFCKSVWISETSSPLIGPIRGLALNRLISINSGVSKRITKDTLITQETTLGTLPRMGTRTNCIIIAHPRFWATKLGIPTAPSPFQV